MKVIPETSPARLIWYPELFLNTKYYTNNLIELSEV
jgi:hypothetical protein